MGDCWRRPNLSFVQYQAEQQIIEQIIGIFVGIDHPEGTEPYAILARHLEEAEKEIEAWRKK